MKSQTIRTWSLVHKWSSLVCTVFMLLLCLTGLPLIFHHEIEHFSADAITTEALPEDTPRRNLDEVVARAREQFPGKYVMYMSQEEDDKTFWYVSLATKLTEREVFDFAIIDARTGASLKAPDFYSGFMYWMTRLHIDLFMGLPGMLFLGFMGLLLVVAIVSGIVLYAPFMQKLSYGQVRRDKSTRVRWLDLHNLLGITTLAWALVVGLTGVINTLEEPIVNHWREHHLQPLLARSGQGDPPPQASFVSLDAAVRQAEAAHPDMTLSFIAFPGVLGGTSQHYTIYLQGKTPLTSKVYNPVLVDVRTGESAGMIPQPWYVQALHLSQPLHFGDYGGMPMKILWALLDLITIVVLGSGLYLWLRKPASQAANASLPADAAPGAQQAGGTT
ncbi:MAG: PepSY-associated TM helix domain-containing protein [Hylemonella sp.]|uniref:PepSY-associated TM helix domain-containing protein n=1 Tax=Hylemonella sp. TaxID=2066020 RepID=UPI00391931DD